MSTLIQENLKTMSSREIAELVGKRHDNVKRLIDNLADKGVIRLPQIEDVRNHQEQLVKTYIFSGEQGKRDSIVVVAQLSPEFTAKLVDRWAELEQQAKQLQIPQSFAEALQLAANQALKIEQDAPKVAHYNAVVDRHTLLTATQVGQKIGLSAIRLNRVLSEIGVYNKAHKRGKAFKQWFIDKGLGEMKQTDMGYSQPLFSLKGEAWVIERLANESVA